MIVLLDTNAYSDMRRGHAGVADIIRRASGIVFSSVVAGELFYGFYGGSKTERNIRELRDFLDSAYVSLMPVTLATADRFGRIASTLRQNGTPIPTNDIWIAAQAMECGAELISSDPHFDAVPGLVRVQPEQHA